MNILVTGTSGFIGHHLVKRLKKDGHRVVAVDQEFPKFEFSVADVFLDVDLRFKDQTERIFEANGRFDEVYNLAANTGGVGFAEKHKATIMRDNVLISVNVLEAARKYKSKKLFFSSSACVYNTNLLKNTDHLLLSEDMIFPAEPDPGYGWEKLFTEMMSQHFREDFGLETRIARLFNIYGPLCTWQGGREKAPAAICRKIILAKDGGEMEMWGDGKQTRSFMYIDDCIEGILRVTRSDYPYPINLDTDYRISLDELARLIITFDSKDLTIKHTPGPLGAKHRNSDTALMKTILRWTPSIPIRAGMRGTYDWIKQEVVK